MARLAVDIGGTFTDVALELDDGTLETSKVPTTPKAPEQGVMNGVRLALEQAGLEPGAVTSVIHGTTLATNALIERKGAVTGLICTEGFRDTLRLAYENRYDQYDVFLQKPDPIVPRHLTLPVGERMDVKGKVLAPIDESAVPAIARQLRDEGVEAVAIGLLHAYANPDHEQRVRDLLLAEYPDVYVTLSSEVCPEVREYERLTTATCNAYVQPLMARYLQALDGELKTAGIAGPMLLMTSGGGVCALETAMRFPIRLVESGPSGGAIMAATVAAERGEGKVVSYDMGGTTAKICLIDDATPQTARTFEIARAARFMKGSGLPVRIPVIEMIEIGAGGGSVARLDTLKRITVGPDSAGSEPGPACYGRGGTDAAVTDADLTLGRLDAEAFAEGRMTLDRQASADAIVTHVAEPLGLTADEGALGISEVVDENMANAARVHAVERGKDLRQRTMIAFGGAGPLHACRMADKLQIPRVVIPKDPGVGSAVGFLRAPIAYEVIRSRYMTTAAFRPDAVNQVFEALRDEANAIVRQGAPEGELTERRSCFMRYLGQGHEIEVMVSAGMLDDAEAARLGEAYNTEYARMFRRAVPGMDIEILGWKLVVAAGQAAPQAVAADESPHYATLASHRALIDPAAGVPAEAPAYDRATMKPGAAFHGPCVIAEGQTTTVVTGAYDGRIDGFGHIVLQRREEHVS
ncbi:MAG: methylhydantoinase [Rhodospirillaceae bacterium]|nr:methylhydantoinase [Rhodospirillaceae bacterium]|tara:strand:- start:7365 stop:9446 length:2082 start_codon:yes stop_codon:yes gene_type:complete